MDALRAIAPSVLRTFTRLTDANTKPYF